MAETGLVHIMAAHSPFSQETSRRIIADGGVQNVSRLRRLKLASFAERCADTAAEI